MTCTLSGLQLIVLPFGVILVLAEIDGHSFGGLGWDLFSHLLILLEKHIWVANEL